MKPISLAKEWIGRYKGSLLFNRLVAVLSIDIMVKLSSVILLPVYLRLMTQDEYGLYGYLLSIIQVFSVVLNFGLYIPLSKFYHDYETKSDKAILLFSIACLLFGILILILFPIYYFGFDHQIVRILFKNPIDYAHYRWPVFLALVATVMSFMLTNFFFTSEKINHLKKYNIFRILGINIISVVFLFLFKGKDSVMVRLQTTYIVELVLFVIFSYFYLIETQPKFSKQIAMSS